jgi:hypothetical protein
MISWTRTGRAIVFTLSAMSIWCLLSEFYGLCSMRTFTFWILIPATLALLACAVYDRQFGNSLLWKNIVIGSMAGLAAAVAYDLFRIPFVVAAIDHVGPHWLRLPLFKVFPRFGAMILGQPFTPSQTDSQFTLTAHLVGWMYHLSNGITFGIMYLALLGDARRHAWAWGIVMAVSLEIVMLITPYTRFFSITLTTRFVIVTLLAHAIFGIVLGWIARIYSQNWLRPAPSF